MACHFGTGIEQEHIACLGGVDIAVVVERLSVGGGDDGEGDVAPLLLLGNGRHGGTYLCLVNARTHHTHHGDVHIHRHIYSLFNLGNLLVGLVVAHIHHGTDEGDAGPCGLSRRGNVQ